MKEDKDINQVFILLQRVEGETVRILLLLKNSKLTENATPLEQSKGEKGKEVSDKKGYEKEQKKE